MEFALLLYSTYYYCCCCRTLHRLIWYRLYAKTYTMHTYRRLNEMASSLNRSHPHRPFHLRCDSSSCWWRWHISTPAMFAHASRIESDAVDIVVCWQPRFTQLCTFPDIFIWITPTEELFLPAMQLSASGKEKMREAEAVGKTLHSNRAWCRKKRHCLQ